MRCSNCGAENAEGKKFCGDCGAELENRCERCGTKNPASNRFCGDCGATLFVTSASTSAQDAAFAEGERRHLTVLFSDLVGSTKIAAHLDPEEWREIAARYQQTAAAAVTRFGGYTAKYFGDGLMVFFGWPEAHEDDAERAVRAGLAIVNDVADLNEGLIRQHKLKLSVRVGIQTGSVVVGLGGGSEADVFGDAPNIASRVQSEAEPDSVLITDAVRELIAGRFTVEDRGTRKLKGIERPVRLYQALQHIRTPGGRHRTTGRIQTPFVGREDDVRLLLSRWKNASEGRGQLVLLVGEPGIGKSRMVEEFRARIRDDSHRWIESGGEELFQGTPFHTTKKMLAQGLRLGDDHSIEERIAQLERELKGTDRKLDEAVPLFAGLLDLSLPKGYAPLELAPDQRRRRLLANLTAWVLDQAKHEPMVLVTEDLHWVDPSTLELMQTLVEQAATARLMLLCTARPEFYVPWRTRSHHVHITLNRLNERDTREMIAGVVARAAMAEGMIDAVVKRTDGVPLFAEELTRLILEGDARSAGQEIPATLHDSLTARLDKLGSAKEIAQVAAVIGRDFSYKLLRAVVPQHEAVLESALEKLVDAELIYARGVPPDASYQFKHALMRDAAYEALLKTRRRSLHSRVALALTSSFRDIADAQPELVARHWTSANEIEPAIAAWRRAGDAAFLRYACKETELSYREALDLFKMLPESAERDERELDLLNRFVPVLQLTRGWGAPEAIQAVAQARALAEKTNNLGQLLLQLVGSFVGVLSRGDIAAASALASHVFELTEREGSPPVLGLGRVINLSACYFQGDLRGAEKNYLAGEALFAIAGERFPSTVGSGFGFGSHVAWLQGRAYTARERINSALKSATDLGSAFELAYTKHIAAMLYLFLREFADAKAAAAESVALADEHGFLQYASGSRVFMGIAQAGLGHPDEGMALIHSGLEGLNESGAGIMMALYLSWVAIAQSRDGDVMQALESIDKALLTNPAELVWRPETTRIRGELRFKLGRTKEAEADFRDAITFARNIESKAWELRAAMSLSQVLRDSGHCEEAREMLAKIYNWFTEGLDTADLKDAKCLLAELS